MSSVAGLLPVPNSAVYAATKAYVNSFSEAMRAELRSSNISVTALCPGPVETEFLSRATRRNDSQKHTAPDCFIVSVESRSRSFGGRSSRPRTGDSWRHRKFGDEHHRFPADVYQTASLQNASKASTQETKMRRTFEESEV